MFERIACCLIAVLLVAPMLAAERQLLVEGHSLIAKTGDERIVIKRLAKDQEFQGYGFLEDDVVFMAYSTDAEGGASTILAVYEGAQKRERFLCELGATGESSFAVSASGSDIAFNWRDAIYVMPVDRLLTAREPGPLDCPSIAARILDCQSCYAPVWVGPSRVRYQIWEDPCWRTRELDIPELQAR